MGNRTDDPAVARIMAKIRARRIALGLGRNEAADLADMHGDQWGHTESKGHSTTIRVAERMARAVGMKLTVIPLDQGEPPAPELPSAPVADLDAARVRLAAPIMRRFLATIKGHREALGLTHEEAGARVGWAKSTFGNMERGHPGGHAVGIERIDVAARAVGLSLELVPETHRAFLELDADELEWLVMVAQWYRARAPRLPVVGVSACDKLDKSREQAAAA